MSERIKIKIHGKVEEIDEETLISLLRRGKVSPGDAICSQTHTRGVWVSISMTEFYGRVMGLAGGPPDNSGDVPVSCASPGSSYGNSVASSSPGQPHQGSAYVGRLNRPTTRVPASQSIGSKSTAAWVAISAAVAYMISFFLPWARMDVSLPFGFGLGVFEETASCLEAAKAYPLMYLGPVIAVMVGVMGLRHRSGDTTPVMWNTAFYASIAFFVYHVYFYFKETSGKLQALDKGISDLAELGIDVSINFSWGIGLYVAFISIAAMVWASFAARGEAR
jgi:hypothetical protein